MEIDVEGDRLGDAVEGEVAGDLRFVAVVVEDDAGRHKFGVGGGAAEEVGLAAVLARAEQMAGQAAAGGGDLGDGDRDVDLRRGGIGGVDDEGAGDVAKDAGVLAEAEMIDFPHHHRVARIGGVGACGNARLVGGAGDGGGVLGDDDGNRDDSEGEGGEGSDTAHEGDLLLGAVRLGATIWPRQSTDRKRNVSPRGSVRARGVLRTIRAARRRRSR